MKFEEGLWEDKGAYRKMKIFQISKDSYVQLVHVKPKSKVKKHYHKEQTEVFSIRGGKAILGIGDSSWSAEKGDVFLCSPGSIHWVVNENNEPFELLVFKYGWVENDTIWIED